MNKEFGGAQPIMQDTKIDNEEDFGPYDHPHQLQPGQTQKMFFNYGHPGPYYLSPEGKNQDNTTIQQDFGK